MAGRLMTLNGFFSWLNITMTNRNVKVQMGLIFLALFFVQPFFTLLLVLLFGWLYCPRRYWWVGILAILGTAYIALINTTKLPASDLEVYLDWYGSAKDLSLLEFLALFSREPIFYTWMYFVSLLTNNETNIFIFLTSWFSYFILVYGVLLVGRRLKIDPRLTAVIVIMLLFLPPLFSISAHLMRQFLAAALVTLFFSKRLAGQNNPWWILVAAIFVHYSSIIFVPLVLLRLTRRFSRGLSIILFGAVLWFMYVAAKAGSIFFVNAPVFGLVFQRVAAETVPDVVGLTLNAIVFIVIVVIMAVLNLLRRHGVGYAVLSNTNSLVQNVNISVLSIGVIAIISNLSGNTAEVAMRLYFYLYCLAGLVILLFAFNSKRVLMFLSFAAALEVLYFYLALEFGVWHYAPTAHILLAPAWLVFGSN